MCWIVLQKFICLMFSYVLLRVALLWYKLPNPSWINHIKNSHVERGHPKKTIAFHLLNDTMGTQ